jgi:mono/diheme cytochrome c family protein
MFSSSLRRILPLTLAIVVVLALFVAACGSTPTATAVPPTATRAALPPTATSVPAAGAATKAPAAATTAPATATGATAPAASSVSFSKDVLPIFKTNCTRCHGGSGPRAGLSLESYQNVMKGSSNGAVVVAGNLDKSLVYTLVKGGIMPFGGPKLADSDAQKIFDWIKEGAPNN